FGAIGSEEETIQTCLHEIFKTSTNYRRFVGVLEENFVVQTFATARLLYGGGEDAETMVELLGQRRAENLRERVDIDFARTNPRDFGPTETVTLAVDVKNVDRMLVKVFEIDPVAYFDRFGTAVNSALDLDGLVANDTQILTFDASPMARIRRSIELPSVAGPGTFVVELIGGGVSSRAVVVKGGLQLLERPTAAGHALLVLDGDGQPAPDAVVRFGGRDYLPGEDGSILVPYTPAPGKKRVLLRSGAVSSVANFDHAGETYRLAAAVHTPLEGLLAGLTATVIVRPSLVVNGTRISLATLDSGSLVITAMTQDGTKSRQVYPDLELTDGRDLAQEIRVPERVASLEVQLRATVRSLTQGKDVELVSSLTTLPINSSHRSSPFRAFLTETPDGYALDLLGRAGEPVADRLVNLDFLNRAVGVTERVQLKTDPRGRVLLGDLTDIAGLRLISPAADSWTLKSRGALGLPSRLHMQAGGRVFVPGSIAGASVARSEASLLRLDGSGKPLEDAFDSLSFANGYFRISGLSEGS
ncbi:MAG: hypothetical protein AAGG01_03255, partial [Planctomycetota bacterium]